MNQPEETGAGMNKIIPIGRIPGSKQAFGAYMRSIKPAINSETGEPYTVDEPAAKQLNNAFWKCRTCNQIVNATDTHGTTVVLDKVTLQRTNKSQPCPTCSPAVIEARTRAKVDAKIKRLVDSGIFYNAQNMPVESTGYTFATYPKRGDQKAKREVRKFVDGETVNMFLSGDVGLGKSGLSAAAANELTSAGFQVLTISTLDYIALIKDNFNKDESNEIEEIVKRVKFLFLDDLGAEGGSKFNLEKFQEVIQYRYDAGLRTCISSNFDLPGLANYWIQTGVSFQPGRRTVDRLRGWYTVVTFTGASLR